VGTLANGDKMYDTYRGSSTLKDNAVETAEGAWSFTGGTGKLKGVKGKGSYKGKGAPDGSATYEVEGEYELPKVAIKTVTKGICGRARGGLNKPEKG
jgi:stalled ribosome alternative rescue factor ArfA